MPIMTNSSKTNSLKDWLTSVFETHIHDDTNADNAPSNHSLNINSAEEYSNDREHKKYSLKAIDLEISNSLCMNEVRLLQQKNNQQHDAMQLKVYAYLVIKLSQALSRGEICIELSKLYDMEQRIGILPMPLTFYTEQFATLHHIDDAEISSAKLAQKNPFDLVIDYPLVLMQGRLYFSRYWFYQQQVFFSISARLEKSAHLHQQTYDYAQLSDTLKTLFPRNAVESSSAAHSANNHREPDWQMIAAASACLNRFSVITGGPGTGKTTTVTRLLAALISQRPKLRIALAAPTGKAAARLVESILGAKGALAETFPLAKNIPVTSFTLHRLLGWRPSGFSYNHKKTLPYDLVIVDEASMVDLPMMAQLMEALADQTQLILLGDKDQLASVEAGSVLGDLCDSGVMINNYHAHGLTVQRAVELEQLCGFEKGSLDAYIETSAPLMVNSLTQLRVSHRFTQDSGIGVLATAVNAGSIDGVEKSFQQYHDIQLFSNLPGPFQTKHSATDDAHKIENSSAAEYAWQQQVILGYGHYLTAIKQGAEPAEVLTLFNQFQLLCGVRQGSSGLHALNDRVQSLLHSRGLLDIDMNAASLEQNRWYVGRPVMISRNDYELNLFNGDIGIAMMVDSGKNEHELRVCFIASDSDALTPKIRQLLPTRLPDHETAYAMTVHKSQGSEFDDVALVLPETYSPVISRELIYTAITRGKKTFSLYSNEEVLQQGIRSRIERASGLRSLLFSK